MLEKLFVAASMTLALCMFAGVSSPQGQALSGQAPQSVSANTITLEPIAFFMGSFTQKNNR